MQLLETKNIFLVHPSYFLILQADLSSTGHREPSKVDKMIDWSAWPFNICLFQDIEGEFGAQCHGEASDAGWDVPKVSFFVCWECSNNILALQWHLGCGQGWHRILWSSEENGGESLKFALSDFITLLINNISLITFQSGIASIVHQLSVRKILRTLQCFPYVPKLLCHWLLHYLIKLLVLWWGMPLGRWPLPP